MPEETFQFSPPNRAKMWRELALTMSQAAALTGVSERQIQHWMDRGYILPHAHGTRKINGENLDMIVLIRQARVSGIPLRRAVAMARERLSQREEPGLDGWVSPSAVDSLVEQLMTLRSGIGSLENVLRGARPGLSAAALDGV
jgi:DNA-binding transcriptional MerR regulator